LIILKVHHVLGRELIVEHVHIKSYVRVAKSACLD